MPDVSAKTATSGCTTAALAAADCFCRDLPRSVVGLWVLPSARDEPRDRPARIRPRGHPLRPREQLRAAVRLCGGDLRRARRAGTAPIPRRDGHLDEGRLRHVARTVWRSRLAQVPPREPRPEPRADEARLRRHLLLAPLRPRHAARGDDGRAHSAVRAGKALYAGISSYSAEKTREAAAILRDLGTPLLIHQPSYSRLNRWIEPRPARRDSGSSVLGCIAFSPLAQGMLTSTKIGAASPTALTRKLAELALARAHDGRDAREGPCVERHRRPLAVDTPAQMALRGRSA